MEAAAATTEPSAAAVAVAPPPQEEKQKQKQKSKAKSKSESKAKAKPKAEGEKKRKPAVFRVVGGRIYDPLNGKTCHQCRQKTMDLSVPCHMIKKKNKLCTIMFCEKCLHNRYGEEAEEEILKETWTCPKCRDICNCSFCMKKKGMEPTGILAHVAKASGCTSVHELLNKGGDAVAAAQKSVQKEKSSAPPKVSLKRALGLEDGANAILAEGDENVSIDLNRVPALPVKKKAKRVKNGPVDPLSKDGIPAAPKEIVLPRGVPVTSVGGAELELDDIGSAIQFFEFCHSFTKVLNIRKGQPERILHDIAGGRGLRVVSSVVAEFHMDLLSSIQENKGMKPVRYSRDGDEWIIDVGKCISGSAFLSKELDLDCLKQGVSGYKNLSPSCKLRVLNFLCDEALSTEKFRSCIVVAETKNAAKDKDNAAKEKGKEIKGLKNGTAKATPLESNGATITLEENKNATSQIQEATDAKTATIKEEKLGSTLRVNPVMADNGIVYWKLEGYCYNSSIMLQEIDTDDLMGNKDKWFMLTEDEEKVIEECASKRSQSRRTKKALV